MIEERRKAQDNWVYIARGLSIAGWLFFIIALIISYYAAPEENYGLLRYHNIKVRDFWLTPLTDYLYLVLWFSALSSYFCILVDKYRGRRKSDSKHFNAILLLIVTLAWVAYLLAHVTT